MQMSRKGLLFSKIADRYDRLRAVPDYLLRELYSIIFQETRLDEKSVVLDVGVGTGRTVGPLLEHDIQLVGLDVSLNMLLRMKEKMKMLELKAQVELMVADGQRLPLKDSSFDMVEAIHVLSWLSDWKTFIQEVKRVLKPNGFLVVGQHSLAYRKSKIGRKYLEVVTQRRRSGWKRALRRVFGSSTIDQIGRLRALMFEEKGRWKTFLEENSASAWRRKFKWREVISGPQIIEQLRESRLLNNWRKPSDSCQISDEEHEMIISNIKECYEKEFGVNSKEEVEIEFKIDFAQF